MIPVNGQEGPADVCVIELSGTTGDIDSMPFIEALGQFSYRVRAGHLCLIHVSLVPVLNVLGEQKTKPTQHSIRGLRGLGLTPNILACRSAKALGENVKGKLSQFCHVPIPLLLRDQKAHEAVLKQLNLMGYLEKWNVRTEVYGQLCDLVRITMVGKYTGLSDSYLCLEGSFTCFCCLLKETYCRLRSCKRPGGYYLERDAWDSLKGADGVLFRGGFVLLIVECKGRSSQQSMQEKIMSLSWAFACECKLLS
ncbi:hypothetical protein NL676_007017 [Syzygium grande]|nr:hypothetical protein NL676_007017 [Syzygium grande]